MNLYKIVEGYLWIAPHALLAVVAVLMIRKRLYREFPVFFSYAVFEVAQCAVLVTMALMPSVSKPEYYYANLMSTAVSTALRFGVIHEIFQNVFRNYAALSGLGRVLLRWATGMLVLLGAIAAGYASSSNLNRFISTLYVTGLAVNIVQCGLLLLLFVFSRYFGLSWRNYVFGTALGLGIYATISLIDTTVESQFGAGLTAKNLAFLDILTMGTYHASVLIWMFYMLAPEPVMVKLKAVPAHDLDVWNNELERLLEQ
jgi:hypothetical protein